MVLDPNAIPDLSGPKLLRIPAREIIPQVQPPISVGEVLRFAVRSNDGGQGQLYFRGLLISASLPPGIKTGDKIFAQVTEADNNLLLKILRTETAGLGGEQAVPSGAPQIPAQALIASELQELMRGTMAQIAELRSNVGGTAAANDIQPYEQAAGILSAALERITANVATAQTLGDPQTAHAQLVESAHGNTAQTLRQAAEQLRNLTEGIFPRDNEAFLLDLQKELNRFLEEGIGNNYFSKKQIEAFISGTTQELRGQQPTAIKDRQTLAAVLQDFSSARDNPQTSLPYLQSAEEKLRDALSTSLVRFDALDPKSKSELQHLADRLDQLARTQETLQQLNPMMQALGEPALILFPFLAHGLLKQSELTFESSFDRKNLGGGRDEPRPDDDEVDTTPYQRIQVSVPLSEFGTVHVDIAHRRDEILVRFDLQHSDHSEFLKSRLGELNGILSALNFSKSEFTTAVSSDIAPVLPALFQIPKTFVA
jgi:hypothetical protein